MKNDDDVTFKGLFLPLTIKKVVIFIFIIGFIVFFNALFGEFLIDEKIQIANNPVMHSTSNILSFFATPANVGAEKSLYYYRPVPYSLYDIFFVLFGQNSFFYHLFQLCLHIITSILIFVILDSFFKKKLALFLAIVFLVHPINVEAVSWITYLQDTMYVFFGVLAFFLFQRNKNKNILYNFAICFLLILSLFSKETGLLFCLIIPLYGFLFNHKKYFKLSLILSVIPLGVYGLIRFIIAKNYYLSTPLNAAIIKGNLLTLPKMIFYYLKTFFFPKDLATPQQWFVHSASIKDFYLPLSIDIIFAALLFALGFYIWNKKREQLRVYLFFLIWFILGLLPHLELWLLDMTVADRWFYFSIMGLLGLLGVLFKNISFNYKRIHKVFIAYSVIIITALSSRTIVRSSNFENNLSLLKHDAPIVHNFTAEKLLIDEYLRQKKYINAKKELPNMVRYNPNDPLVWEYQGVIEYKTGDYTKAKYFFNKLYGTPYDLIVYKILPQILVTNENNFKEAERILIEGTHKYPKDTQLWEWLAIIEFNSGNKAQAQQAALHTNKTLELIIK